MRIAALLLLFSCAPNTAFGEDQWPPVDLEGGWSIERIEFAVDGRVEKGPHWTSSPRFCLFAADYHYWFQDRDRTMKFVAGDKVMAHSEEDGTYYFLWNYGRQPSKRIQIRKEGDQLLMTWGQQEERGKTRSVFRLTRIDKEKVVISVQALLNNGDMHPSCRQFSAGSEVALMQWLGE